MYSIFRKTIINSFYLVSILFGGFLYSQEQEKKSLFDIEVQNKVNQYKAYSNFKKAGMFYIENNWDSTLVYSMHHLNEAKQHVDLANYAHYFRGYSFKVKKLYQEAKKEFHLIAPEFQFDFIVKKRLGEIVIEENEFKQAIAYLEPLTKLSSENYRYLKKSEVFQNLGVCYLHLKEFDKAEQYLIENVDFNKKTKDTLGLVAAYGAIANLYYELYKDDLAIPYFEKAYQLSKHIKKTDSKRIATLNMAVVEENRKDFEKALTYRKEYEKWNDSLNDQNKIYEVAKIEKEFAVKEKQKEVSLLQAENKAKVIERNGLFYSAVVLLLLLGVTMYFYKEKIKTNRIIVAQKENLDELNATKDKLFSIVSHDLRSSVNALKTSNATLLDNLESRNLVALDGLLQNNSAIVNGAYNLLDNLLHWALLQTKQSYFEITSLRLFFIVEQVAYNYKPLMLEKNVQFENTVSKKDVVLADQESLKIVLRNLLDNAIKFSKANGSIKIYTLNTNETYCDLVVEDSGLGMSETARLELLNDTVLLSKKEHENIIGTGLGLQLCKSMIKKNKGKFSIESELGKGTKMIVSLPKTT
ncbi:ATP-binding protein [Mariniflexile gromovii]|uniref:histidine kinase n=1 Tax=Mariniflexile gromovii TaxID=362523 RepID=A0ABS4BRB4_9FLAO|nr:tetratricopeptide repeat-containing sensor histidine kinase [Mariniflexile gromovii]MBP0903121.1 tetratricopeptide repeat-containing sensor histidine kinase [Mariniflexile gromovii]